MSEADSTHVWSFSLRYIIKTYKQKADQPHGSLLFISLGFVDLEGNHLFM